MLDGVQTDEKEKKEKSAANTGCKATTAAGFLQKIYMELYDNNPVSYRKSAGIFCNFWRYKIFKGRCNFCSNDRRSSGSGSSVF